MPGCGGCGGDPIDEEARAKAKEELEKKKAKAKPDFETPKLTIMPQKLIEGSTAIRPVKPGHWMAAVEQMKANNFDFVGQLYAEVRDSGSGKVLDLERTPHKLAVVRPAPLPKGQAKFFELMFMVPSYAPRAWLATELRSRGGGAVTSPGPEPLSLLKAHQFNFLVLAGEDRYSRLESLDCIRAPHAEGYLNYYQVIRPVIEKPLPLPSNSMAWTNIAYMVWDDVDPQMLTLEQQKALVDWLHWGGQLIVSGPKSLDQLRGKSFLGPYLPATAGEAIKISAEKLAPISKYWTLTERGQPARPLAPVNPWSGVELKLQGDAKFVPHTADLVAEREVGRGRIVTTAFRLTQRDLWNWAGCDGFWNAVLLHRPPRKFSTPQESLGNLQVDFVEGSPHHLNPTVVSQLRFLSRDWKKDDGFDPAFSPPSDDLNNRSANWYALQQRSDVDDTDPVVLGGGQPIGPGVAGWTDFSDVANGARDSLREAAGIVIPKAGFVIWVLILYLVVLVPLNWLLFWGLGRVEWAWIAAPIIAIGGMAAVVKLAQLDIGFARSQTEVAVLETYNGYPRGHLTRYTALYTSLSTSYDVKVDNAASGGPNSVTLPFSVDPKFELLTGQSSSTVTFQSDPEVELADFGVASNSTAMLHTEQMFDLGGAIEYSAKGDKGELTNRTNYTLKRAAIVRRKANGEPQVGWIGDLDAGRSAHVNFVRPDALKSMVPNWSFSLSESKDKKGPEFSIDHIANLFKPSELLTGDQAKETKITSATLRPGETRLIALVDEPLPGIIVDPAASQSGRGATLVITHLELPALSEPKRDANCRRDIVTGRNDVEVFKDEPEEPIDDSEVPDV